MNNISPCQVL